MAHDRSYPKLITGVVIDSNGNTIPKNSIREKVIKKFLLLKNNPENFESRNRLRGLVIAARQVDKSIFPSIREYAFNSKNNQR